MNDAAINALYPFLSTARASPRVLDTTLLEAVRQKTEDSIEVKRCFFAEHGGQVVAIAHVLADAFAAGRRLYTMGNGGSSCDAAHIAVEFLHPVTAGRPALPAVNLNADIAMMTAVANDVGFRSVFVRPLIALATQGDALIGVSTSGNSENLLAAFSKAKSMGLATIGLSGMNGGAMAKSLDIDHCLVVRSDSVHRVQETHVAIYHILWDLVHTLLADRRGSTA